jgi:ribosomal protein L11 methyltransferase
MGRAPRFTWRKLSAAKWEDTWWERLSWVSNRLSITAFAGRKTVRLEAFELSRAEGQRLLNAFGGEVHVQNNAMAVLSCRPRPAIHIRGKLLIVATERERRQLRAGRAQILTIPAGMAFGTGDHATTATCLRLLADASDEFRGSPWDMLDLGTGTGILAIAGRMLGARTVLGVDADPDAVRIAQQNVRGNGVNAVRIRKLDVRNWSPVSTWQVVVANLYSGILIEVAPGIAAAISPGGRLIFSGLLREQESAAVKAFTAAGVRVERIIRKGKWVSGLGRRLLIADC